jgi:hypothetical protein
VEAESALILDSLRQGIRQGSFSNIPPMRRCPASIYGLIPVRCTKTLKFPPRSGQGILSACAGNFLRAGREFIFTEEVPFLSEDDREWITGRAIVVRWG